MTGSMPHVSLTGRSTAKASCPMWNRSSLKSSSPATSSIIDNLGSHKGKAVRRAIRAAGAKLFFLPPYSPDLNPIEQVFAKLKTLLRKAAERTVEATWKRIGALLSAFAPQECANYFKNAGYASI
jgi:transposase